MNEYDRLYRQAQRYREMYPEGTRILLLHMGDDPRPVEDDMRGTVKYVDDTRSNGNNILYLVNKYTDLYAADPDQIVYKAKAEKYAKIISKTIILSGMDAASFGQNAYFYDAAEGLLTATILLVAEFCAPEKRHIVSVFKVIQELLAPSKKKGKKRKVKTWGRKLPCSSR